MQTERKYRIDKYLEMARLTKSLEKREAFVDMAEFYLEQDESDFQSPDFSFDYLVGKHREDFVNQKFSDCYRDYSNWCLRNSKNSISKVSFSKKVRGHFDLTSKHNRNGKEVAICFVEPS